MNPQLKKMAYLKFLVIPKDSPFWANVATDRKASQFNERLVYSYLAYCDRIGTATSIRGIAQETGLTPRTVGKALASLGELVNNQNGKWSPVSGKEGWLPLITDADGDHWSDRLQYIKLFLPQKGATIRYSDTTKRFGILHAAVYSQVVSLARRGDSATTSESGLGTLLSGVNRKTIASSLNDLDHLGLISRAKFKDRLRVTLLPVEEHHLKLFRPAPKGEKVPVKKPKPPADPNKYELKGDGLDEYRKMCRGLMPQSDAEKAISMSYELGESHEGFCDFVSETKKWHEDNLLTGKVLKGNLGRFLVARYTARLNEFKRREAESKAQAERLEYLRSDDFRAKLEAEEKAAAADPLHDRHLFGVESITSRVQFDPNPVANYRAAQRLIDELARHLEPLAKEEFKPDKLREMLAEIVRLQLGHALATVNKHYAADTFASAEEFVEGINQALQSIKGRSIPPFFFAPKASPHSPKNETAVHK